MLCVASALVLGAGLLTIDAAYYKGRPPPPGVKLHYGPKPPPHYFNKPPHFHGHLRRPVPIHPPRNHIRPSPRPYIVKPTPPPPPPFPPASWKSHPHSTFSAPVVKETFHSAPLTYTPDITQHFLKDDDKGPIHTIPAPNLSPADRPSHDYPQVQANHDLEAVFRHGLETVQSKPAAGYQVTEDPSIYKPFSGTPSYFAPDPDPSLPTIEVPKTQDPHSLPSNGQQPLDLAYQQQLEESQQYQQQNQQQYQDHEEQTQQHSYTEGASNSLTSQDLYNLLNGFGQQQQQQYQQQQPLSAALYQQYLQAAAAQQPSTYQEVYNAALLYPQVYQQQQQQQQQQQHQVSQFSQQNFHPQFETFNYNEQTQEGAHGSDSFPSASTVSVGVKRAVSKDTSITGENLNSINTDIKDHKNVYLEKGQEDSGEVGVINNQVDYEDDQSVEEAESDSLPANIINAGYYTSLPNKHTAETLATLAAAGNINNQLMKSPITTSERERKETPENGQKINSNNVRIQQNSENNNRQNSIRIDMNLQRNNEMRAQETNYEHKQQSYRNHETSVEENHDEQRKHLYRNHDMGDQENNDEKQNQQVFKYHNAEEQQESSNDKQNQQSYRYQNTNGRQPIHMEKQVQIENNDNREQSFTDSDYSEDEILDVSDKDQRSNNVRIQHGMTIYENSYFNNREVKDREIPVEEQSYEDTESDYSQEEEKERNENTATKSSTTPEKSFTFNSHQNHLPYGAKLRPKRV